MRTPTFILTTVLLASSALAASPATYPIKCNRLLKTGESYDTHILFELTLDSNGGMVNKTPEARTKILKAEITGRIDNVIADPAHNTESFSLTIRHLTNPVTKRDAIRPNSVIDITLSDSPPVFSPHPGTTPIPDNAKVLLNELFFPLGDSSPTSFLDAPTPHALSDSWNVDTNAAATYLKLNQTIILPSSIHGTTTLSKIENTTAPTLRLESTLHGTDFTTAFMPPRANVEKSELTLHTNLLAPTDLTEPLLFCESIFDTTAHITSVTSTIILDQHLHMLLQQTLTPLPPPAAKSP